MRFKMRVREQGGSADWWEEADKPGEDAKKIARQIIATFNASLRHYEKPRELLEVVVLNANSNTAVHDWQKLNAVTQIDRGHIPFDTYRCRACGITGKRFGLAEGIVIDPKFRAKLYRNCAKTQEHFAAKRLKPKPEAKKP